MKLNNIDYRQGDVGLSIITSIPEGFKKVGPNDAANKRIVLALGEKTGHAHAFYETDKVELYTDENDNIILNVLEETNLIHGNIQGTSSDHVPITLDRGLYWYVPQRQYNYWTDSPERVID